MLEQILHYIHNYFERDIVGGTYTVTGGSLSVDFLQTNQYFRIVGSVFNDGVYKYPATDLVDETFTGEIWAMAVPPAVIALSVEVGEWVERYGSAVNSPYQSESFGGYTYSKAQGGGANSTSGAPYSWQNVFASRLNQWRKIA